MSAQDQFERGRPEQPLEYDYDTVEASLPELPPPVLKTLKEKFYNKLILTLGAVLLLLVTVRITIPQLLELQSTAGFNTGFMMVVLSIVVLVSSCGSLLFFWQAGQ